MCQQQIRTSSGNLKGSLSAISAIEPIMTSARRPMSAQRSSMLRSSAKESIRHMAALGLHTHASTKNSEVSPRYCRIYASMMSPTEHPLLCASSRTRLATSGESRIYITSVGLRLRPAPSRLPPRFSTFVSIVKNLFQELEALNSTSRSINVVICGSLAISIYHALTLALHSA